MLDRLKSAARRLRREALTAWYAARDPRMPWLPRIIALAVAGYAFSPIDLIPDFIPVLGLLDDLLIVPLGLALVLRLTPPAVLVEARARAEATEHEPVSRFAAGAIIAVWIGVALLGVAGLARADQYRSEARVPSGQNAAPAQDLKQQAASATDPYQKALLLRELANDAVRRKDYATAAGYLDQAIASGGLSGPAAEQMKSDLAKLRVGSGDQKSVIAALEPQYKSGAKLSPEQLVALGAAYLQQQRYREAAPLLAKGVAERQPADLTWRRALYAAYVGAGQDREAAQVLETVVRDQPSAREDWLRLTALYLKAGNGDRAQAVMEVAGRLGYLDTPEQRLQLIGLTAQIGAPYQAGSLLKTWIDAGTVPRNSANLRTLAALWLAAREAQLASATLDELNRQAPSAEQYLQLGQLHLDREEYKAAAEALAQGIALGGKTGPALMTLGMAQYQQADIDAAVRSFRAAAEYPQSAKLAKQWRSYLESCKARELALQAAATRRTREDGGAAQLAAGLGGAPVALNDANIPSAQEPGAPPAAAASVATSSAGLTPVGAEAAGNRDGSIPPWTGGLTRSQWPAGYKPGTRLADPFAADRPLFTITGANAAQYAARLSTGHRALLAKYPDYSIPVYITRRSVAYPQAIYDATQANLGKAKADAADTLEGARLGFPFAQPKNGVEVMWNHRVRYRGDTAEFRYRQAVVDPDGSVRDMNDAVFRVLFRYANIREPADLSKDNILLYAIFSAARSGSTADYVALVHETANGLQKPRGIWVLITSVGKMFRVPPVGYDQPFPGTEAIQFIDMIDMYNGLFDRYVWKLTGKRELYIPYNSFRLSDGRYRNAELLTAKHLNQSAARYELHRVWVIEATLRPGNGHAFGKRVFYVDEDSWNIVMVENYDPAGALWRFQEGHLLPLYDVQAAYAVPSLTYDLKTGNYFAERLFSESPPIQYGIPISEQEFLPAAVKNKYSH